MAMVAEGAIPWAILEMGFITVFLPRITNIVNFHNDKL
jgi:hypothetical protein